MIKEKHLHIIKDILQKYPYRFYVFGSRAKGNAKPFSDIDLCFFDNIPEREILLLEEEFEESDLPYKVDLVNGQTCDPEFKAVILRDKVSLQNK